MSEVELQNLKRQRNMLKSKLVRFLIFINKIENQSKQTEIKLRVRDLQGMLYTFEKIQKKIDEINGTQSPDLKIFELELNWTITQAHKFMETKSTPSLMTNVISGSPLNVPSQINYVRLPAVELPTFDGTYDKWLHFCDSFRSVIHDNRDLSDKEKMLYLRFCLKEKAHSAINAVENYGVAWQLLTNRFGNKRVLVHNHVKSIMELPNIATESAGELRKMANTITTNLRSLKSLGEPVDCWDTLLIYTFASKLDRSTHGEWAKSITGTGVPKLETFLEFLENHCQILEATANGKISS